MAARPRKTLGKREQKTFKGRFAVHLQALLDDRGWTHHDLANRAGLKEPTLRKWLRGESVTDTLDLEALASALNTPEHPIADYRMVLPPPLGG